MRFPEFSGEWESVRLGDVCKFFSGGTPSSTNKDFYDGDIPFIRSGEIHSSSTELYISEAGLNSSSAKIIEQGDLLLALYGATSGDIAISKIKGAINQAILCIRTNHDNFFLKSCWEKHCRKLLQTYLQGGQGNLSADIVKSIKISFPSCLEQKKISGLLALIEERIETQKKIIEDLKKLKDAIRTKLFTSLESHCNEYDEIRNMLHYEQPSAYLVNSTEYSEDYPTPVLTANKAFILGYTDEEQGVYDKGDCIIFDDFTMDLKYVTFPFKVKSSAIKILTPRQNIDLYFIYEYLLYLGLVSEEHKRHYISEIESMNIIHPQLKEQRQISQALRSLEMQVGNAIALQNLLVKQKQHFLSRMFI